MSNNDFWVRFSTPDMKIIDVLNEGTPTDYDRIFYYLSNGCTIERITKDE